MCHNKLKQNHPVAFSAIRQGDQQKHHGIISMEESKTMDSKVVYPEQTKKQDKWGLSKEIPIPD
jgi:hypothetical protein